MHCANAGTCQHRNNGFGNKRHVNRDSIFSSNSNFSQRIGAVHSVVFGGFSADALLSRIQDADAKLVITADGGFRKGNAFALKPAVDEALKGLTNVKNVLVVKRTGQETAWVEGRDIWWHDLVDRQRSTHTPEFFDSEHPLFILYTSGTTAKPKGIFHTTGGYLTQVAYTHRVVFDIKPKTDIYWCTADVGWITGHSYMVYGPLINGATQVIYEGTPDTPHKGRMFEIIEKYGVTILYTAPTLIRTWMKWGDEFPNNCNLTSLRLLGSVGEPINPEAWMWYREVIGGNRCPIVDTWWQTETGAIMISPLPGVTATKPGSAMRPLPGISAKVVDDKGAEVGNGHGGFLILDQPWPSMLRGVWGETERYKETYWSRFPGIYFAGDGAKLDDDGAIWLMGRVDDVMNVSGHRISTTEVESALVTGYKNGLIKTILRGALFIAGGIAAMYFVVESNQSGWLIVAIIAGAYAGAFVGTLVAKSLRLTIVRGPLRLADSLFGAALEVSKYVLLFFIIGTILVYTPWQTGKSQVAESKVYAELNTRAPALFSEIRKQVEEALEVNLRS